MHQIDTPSNTTKVPICTNTLANVQTDITIKKELFKHVCHERSLLIKQYRSRGRIIKYNAVVIDNSNTLKQSTAMLYKLCTHYHDMSMVPCGRGKFVLYGNNDPLLTITKYRGKKITGRGSRWLIEKYMNDNFKSKAKFQHGYVFVLRVPAMPVRMGVFFKAPIHQDFVNFNHHFRKQDSYNIIDYSLAISTMTEPLYGFKYHKLSNNFDLTQVFNDVQTFESIKELPLCSTSKKNFTVHHVHKLYKPADPDGQYISPLPETALDVDADDVDNSVDALTDNFSKPPSPSKTSNPQHKFISMNRHDKDYYFTTFTNPVTPVIAFITSILACYDK